jgi:hypothetical protein
MISPDTLTAVADGRSSGLRDRDRYSGSEQTMYQFFRTGFRILALFLFTVVSGEAACAEETDWKIGLAKVKITPTVSVFMAGYQQRDHPSEKVASDLYAKAMALEDQNGKVAVLVTTDLIWLRADICDSVAAAVTEQTGLKREQLLFNASHIHTGPSLSLGAGNGGLGRGNQRSADMQRNIEYTRNLQKQLIEVILASLKKREPVRLSWGQGLVNFPMNRREWTPKGVILGVNPRGPADRTVPVLRVESPDGQLRAIVFGAATHNTTLGPSCYEICGDYAGFAQEKLEKQHPGVQAMFMLGCAGDSDPYPRTAAKMPVQQAMGYARQHGAELSQEVERVLGGSGFIGSGQGGKLRPVRGPLRIAYGTTELPLEAGGNVTGRVAVWQFGEDLTLVALSGEVVVDYVALIEKALGPTNLWVAAYSNDVFGYLPSARLLGEGGYETRRGFSAKAQDALVTKVRELATTVGRAVP